MPCGHGEIGPTHGEEIQMWEISLHPIEPNYALKA